MTEFNAEYYKTQYDKAINVISNSKYKHGVDIGADEYFGKFWTFLEATYPNSYRNFLVFINNIPVVKIAITIAVILYLLIDYMNGVHIDYMDTVNIGMILMYTVLPVIVKFIYWVWYSSQPFAYSYNYQIYNTLINLDYKLDVFRRRLLANEENLSLSEKEIRVLVSEELFKISKGIEADELMESTNKRIESLLG